MTHPASPERPIAVDFNGALVVRASELLRSVAFLAYEFHVSDSRGSVYLRAEYDEPDIYTGVVERQHTRKWLLSPLMTDSEIVQTAFKLCMTSMEHRCREGFQYKGARIFGPHFDVNDLAALCLLRENAGGRIPALSASTGEPVEEVA